MRIAEEAQRIADEKARIAEEKLKAKIQKKIDKTDDEEKVAVLQEQLETAHVPRVVVEAPVKLNATQQDFDIVIDDIMDLLKAIVKGEVNVDPNVLFEVKIKVLKDYLKLSGKTSIPGCSVKKTLIQRIK
jgi:folylpolyglutamate synthase/dihydropteroate synthase